MEAYEKLSVCKEGTPGAETAQKVIKQSIQDIRRDVRAAICGLKHAAVAANAEVPLRVIMTNILDAAVASINKVQQEYPDWSRDDLIKLTAALRGSAPKVKGG